MEDRRRIAIKKRTVVSAPKGELIIVKSANAGVTARIKWNPGFSSRFSSGFSKAQSYIDSSVLRLSDPYVPMRSGALKLSGQLGTDIGSGTVQYIAPYARRQYYENAGRGAEGTALGGRRGALWFERMKADNLEDIERGVRRILRKG